VLATKYKKRVGKESDESVRDGGRKSRVRRKQCSGGPTLGVKREGRGQECMGMDLGM